MTKLRVATFNVENLFARWKFGENIDPVSAKERGWIVEAFEELGEDSKALTGKAIKELNAHVTWPCSVNGQSPGCAPISYWAGGNDYKQLDYRCSQNRWRRRTTASRRSCARGCRSEPPDTRARASMASEGISRRHPITVRS
jgi:hypothetical protein